MLADIHSMQKFQNNMQLCRLSTQHLRFYSAPTISLSPCQAVLHQYYISNIWMMHSSDKTALQSAYMHLQAVASTRKLFSETLDISCEECRCRWEVPQYRKRRVMRNDQAHCIAIHE